jgi:hypothetical protein
MKHRIVSPNAVAFSGISNPTSAHSALSLTSRLELQEIILPAQVSVENGLKTSDSTRRASKIYRLQAP